MEAHAIAGIGVLSAEYVAGLGAGPIGHSRILIVADGVIVADPFPAPPEISNEIFGLSNVIATLRRFSSPVAGFEVTVATRNGGDEPLPGFDLTGFRFDDADLASYDQIWLFGHEPGNVDSDNLDPAVDVRLADIGLNHMIREEIAALAQWMDAGGGVFAAGDHHLLGGTLCFRVPRVSSMRRWSVEDGVPSQHEPTRYDTTRPATPQQLYGHHTIPISAENDEIPQTIEWVPFEFQADNPMAVRKRPHPLLCHPTLGPIDVLPDHPHEGLCHVFDTAWRHRFAEADYFTEVDGNQEAHPLYPQGPTGARPLPQVVAWGYTLAAPPLDFEKGPQPARRFPLIAAYDGHKAGIGRVVVDSTWHHWFDGNMEGFERVANDSGLRDNFDKIRRYHVNVALWLAPRQWRVETLARQLKLAQMAQEWFNPNAPVHEIGRDAAAFLNPLLGPCWVSASILEQIDDLSPGFAQALCGGEGAKDGERPDLPGEDLVFATLGGLVRALYADMDELRKQLAETGQVRRSPLAGDLARHARTGALQGLREGVEAWRGRVKRASAACAELGKALPGRAD